MQVILNEVVTHTVAAAPDCKQRTMQDWSPNQSQCAKRSEVSRLTCAMVVLCILTSSKYIAAQESVKTIVDNVEACERLYDNIDVVFEKTMNHKLRKGLSQSAILEYRVRGQMVKQDNLFRVATDMILHVNSEPKPERHRDAVAYDGDQTRIVMRRPAPASSEAKESNVSNITRGRKDPVMPYCPHTELLPKSACTVPLSIWLKGGKDLANHRHAHEYYRSGKWEKRVSVVGREAERGHHCVKIKSETWDTSRKLTVGLTYIWLAEEKNYVPIKLLLALPADAGDQPGEEAFAEDFKEIQPGIWLPMRIHRDVYDLETLATSGQRVLAYNEDLYVRDVSLSPKHDLEFFRNIEFPPETLVYEVNDGQITSSYRTGKEIPRESSFDWLWWWLGVIATALLVMLMLKSQRAKRAAHTPNATRDRMLER